MKIKTRFSKINTILTVLAIIAIVAIVFAFWRLFGSIGFKSYHNNASSTNTTTQIVEKEISDKNDFYEITATYPSDPRDTGKDMQTYVLYNVKQRQNDWKIGGQSYNDQQALEKKYPDMPKVKYTYDISYKSYNSPVRKTVSYVFDTYEFTGGAHGSSEISTFTFNDSGLVSIENILDLKNDNDIKLSRLLATQLLSKKDATDNDFVMNGLGLSYLKSDGKTVDLAKCGCDGFFFGSNFQKFYVTDSGITFLFDQYKVAPGAAGTMEATLDWATLKPYLLNPNF